MSTNYRLDTTIALKITRVLPTYLTNFVATPGRSILSFMSGFDANFGEKTSVDGIRHPEEEITVSSEIEYNFKYARKYARRLDMPAVTDAVMIEEEYYAGDLTNAMGHISDIGENFIEGLNLLAMQGSLKPLMYGLEDYPSGTTGTRERPEQCAPVTAAGKWDVPNSIPSTLVDMESVLIGKRFYGPKLVIANNIVKPYLSNVLSATAVPTGQWMSSAYGYPVIFSPHCDPAGNESATMIYMVDTSKFAYMMTPLRIKSYFDDPTDHWVWKWQTRFVLRQAPLYDGTDWLKGAVQCDVDLST